MKRLFLPTLLLLSTAAHAQVGIGTNAPDTSSVLDIASGSKPVILPRLSTSAINSIVNPVPGMIVYNSTTGRFMGYGIGNTSAVAIDQQIGGAFTAVGAGGSIGQTFTPSTDIMLTQLLVYATGTALSVPVYICQGATFSNSPVATSTVSSIGNGEYVAGFSEIPLQGGVRYSFWLAPSVGSGSFNVAYSNSNPYPGENAVPNGGVLTTTADLKFRMLKGNFGWQVLTNY